MNRKSLAGFGIPVRFVTLMSLCSVLGCPKDEAAVPVTPDLAKPAAASQPTAAASSQPAGTAPTADAPKGSVAFAWPHPGSTVPETFGVVFATKNLKVVPAGTDIDDPTKGHHHLIIDGNPIAKGTMVPKDATHIHFGKGQTETMVTLTPGLHTLRMQFADGAHRSYGPELSAEMNVTVVAKPKDDMGVSFASPKDDAKVKSPVKLEFAVSGATVSPAGKEVMNKLMGHHHLIIDDKPTPMGTMVGKDATHIHFGKGQTSAEIPLEKGEHTLTLQFADGAHMSYGPTMSKTIKVNVE